MAASEVVPQAGVSPSFFDRRARDYNREYDAQTAGGYALRVRREKVLRLFDCPGGAVLDVGCGPGIMAQPIVDLGCTFRGIDPSPKMLEICEDRFAGNRRMAFLLGDAMALSQPDESYDAVLCMGVIDAVPDGRRAVREMLRVLKPGGTLLITFTNAVSPYSWWKRYVYYPAMALFQRWRGYGTSPDPKGRTIYKKATARELLESEGAQVSAFVGYYYNVFLSPLDELFPSLALWVTRKLEEGHWPRPEWIASGWVVKAKKPAGGQRLSSGE